jgi:hypothetical protein
MLRRETCYSRSEYIQDKQAETSLGLRAERRCFNMYAGRTKRSPWPELISGTFVSLPSPVLCCARECPFSHMLASGRFICSNSLHTPHLTIPAVRPSNLVLACFGWQCANDEYEKLWHKALLTHPCRQMGLGPQFCNSSRAPNKLRYPIRLLPKFNEFKLCM